MMHEDFFGYLQRTPCIDQESGRLDLCRVATNIGKDGDW